MHIALVANIENEPVAAGVKYFMNSKRRLYDTEIRRQMPARLRNMRNKKRADLPSQLRILCSCKTKQIVAGMDG